MLEKLKLETFEESLPKGLSEKDHTLIMLARWSIEEIPHDAEREYDILERALK